MPQFRIDDTLMQRLARVATAYEMPARKMLSIILQTSLDELEGRQDDCTICVLIPHQEEAETK